MGVTQYSTLTESAGTVASINSGTVEIPQFNPALGTLDYVLVSISAAAQGTVGLENLEQTPATLVAVPYDAVILTDGAGDLLSAVDPYALYAQPVAAFDGTVNYAGPSGDGFAIGNIAGTGYAIDEAAYIGTGAVAATLTGTPHLATGGGGNVASVGSLAVGGGSVTVEYVYSNSTTIPATPPITLPSPIPIPPPPLPPPTLPPATMTLVQTAVLADETTGWTQSAVFQQFNPALGTLVAVDVTVITDIAGSAMVENTAPIAAGYTAEVLAEIGLSDAAGVIPATGVDDISGTTTLGAFDGSLDFGGTSGVVVPIANTATASEMLPGPFIDPNIIGTGNFTIQAHGTSYAGLIGGTQYTLQSLLQVGGTVEVSYSYIPCFLAGTRIATPRGEVAIESLRPGDTVRSVLRGTATVIATWHRRLACNGNPALLPVRVRAGAWAPGVPARDLLLSPDHAIRSGDVLIPIRHLIDGDAVAQVTRDLASYWHLQLDRHDIVLAEGMECESYLETDAGAVTAGRANGPAAGLASRVWEAEGCLPLVVTGPDVEQARAHIARRAETKSPSR